MLDMPGKAKSYRPASGKLLPDLGARKVQVKLKDGSLRYVNPRALMAVSEMNDTGHQGARVPREQWHETGARESEWSVRVTSRNCPYSQSTSKNSTSGSYSSLSALEEIKDMMVRV